MDDKYALFPYDLAGRDDGMVYAVLGCYVIRYAWGAACLSSSCVVLTVDLIT